MEVYATTQQKELKELKEWNLTEDTKNQNDIDGNIEFTNDEDIEDYLKSDTKTQDVSTLKKELEEGEFDWDDI